MNEMKQINKNVVAIFDGQAGSCGKGKVIGQYALDHIVEAAIANNMPNAGHTFDDGETKRVFRFIPVSAVNPETQLFIGAGSIIDMDVLVEEYERHQDILAGREVVVHPLVPLIEKRHINQEQQKLASGSTFKGGGACLTEKIMRSPELRFFKQYKNIKASPDYHHRLLEYLKTSRNIILEGSQGSDLDINHSGHYPYVTSRQISIAQMCADSGISPQWLKEIIMVIRPFPIRISNKTNIGKKIYSGHYGNSEELTWDQINVGSALGQHSTTITDKDIEESLILVDYDYTEITTVTKQERRIFDLDINQLKRTTEINLPTSIYLNFFQHLNDDFRGQKGQYQDIYFDRYIREYLNWLEAEVNVPITMLGTGSKKDEYIVRNEPNLQKSKRIS